ncbi:tetratricopeptide repeat protein [Amycolatopsis sp. NPDC004625]|uniref:tetratricopeptide repeat protein n=1 Tax=Amycolatopsis sp. NPDC004625 TaxID=3154670 RepID=UPI0033A5E791
MLNQLGLYLVGQGDVGTAIGYFTRACDSLNGPDHPHALNSRNNLACAYQMRGDRERAIQLYEVALAGSERVLGPGHPTTRTIRSNLDGVRPT